MRKFLLLFLPLFLLSCANIKEVQCTGVKGFKINKVSTEGINADILLTIKNPNSFRFFIYPSEFNVKYGGVKLGKAKLENKVRIDGNAEQTYPFSLIGDFKGLTLGDVMKALESFTRQGFLEIDGDIKVGKLFVKKTFPVNVKQKIATE
jgi:LEA14-like dessication related protein